VLRVCVCVCVCVCVRVCVCVANQSSRNARSRVSFACVVCSIVLYTKEFYDFAVTKLNPGGVLVTQSGPGSIMNITECNSVIHKTLKTAFTHVLPYACDIPSFGCNWGFNVAFNDDCAFAKAAAEAGASPQDYVRCVALRFVPLLCVSYLLSARVSPSMIVLRR